MKIKCRLGDITDSEAEVIVNAANNHLWMGSGVAGAIKQKGGTEIEREAMAMGPIKVGDAIATGAGNLRQKYVIHAAAMGQDLHTDAIKIRNATRNSLLKAEELGISSIDFPALGTGVGGFSVEQSAKIMIQTARSFKNSRTLKEIGFILFDQISFQAFQRELERNPED